MTTTAKDMSSKDKVYVTHAPPPIQSVITLIWLGAFIIACLPSREAVDEVATIDVFTNRVFPHLVSLHFLIYARVTFCILVFSVTLFSVFPGNGWVQVTAYLPASKLRKTDIVMEGVRTLCPYTSWAWNLLGVSFALSAYIAHQAGVHGKQDIPQPLLRVAFLLYEIAAPSALLVSFVVSYAIWPNIIRQGASTANIKAPRTLIWHNANIVMALAETVLLGGIPVRFQHMAVAPTFGMVYVLFSWSLMHYWKPSHGPQFLYFFFDTTLGTTSTYAMVILMAVMLAFYGLFAFADLLLDHFGGGLVPRLLFVIVTCTMVCRFRD